MKGIQDLREAKASKTREARNLLDSTLHAFTPEIKAKVEALYAEIENLGDQIGLIEKSLVLQDDLEVRANEIHDRQNISKDQAAHNISAAKKAFVKALRYGANALTPEEAAFISADAPANRGRIQNVATTAPATGGVLVPTIIMPTVLTKLKAYGGVRTVAKNLATAGGEPIQWGTLDDTAAEGEMLAEGNTATDDDLSFGTVSIGAYVFDSKTIPISMQMLQDANADVESLVIDALGERIARGQNRKWTTGSGVAEPQGVVTGAALGKTGASATAIAYDELVDTFHSLDPAYRNSSSCAWMMHDTTFQAIRKLKDTQNRPLWLPEDVSAMENPNGTIFGKPIVINQHMATIAAAAKTILFGDFSKYLIRDVMDVLILRFTDSNYAKKAQVGFLAFARADGKLIDASNESIRYYRQL